jgi:ABC-2 type transport system ATP-binding protein
LPHSTSHPSHDPNSAQSTQKLIEVQGLHKVFKDFWGRPKVAALSGIDLSIGPGEVCALVGPNGSGKTTLVKILLGLLFPTKGSAKIFGQHCFELSSKSRIGFLAEENCFYPHLTGMETLTFYSKLLKIPKTHRKNRIDELLYLTDMTEAANRPIGEYSLGMLRRIGIAQALLADPELIILDEPTNGLDPIGIEEIHQLILKLKQRGKSIFICTHLLTETEDICDQICLLHKGKLLASGSIEELHQHYNTKRMKELFLTLVPRKKNKPVHSELTDLTKNMADEASSIMNSPLNSTDKSNAATNEDSDPKPNIDYLNQLKGEPQEKGSDTPDPSLNQENH